MVVILVLINSTFGDVDSGFDGGDLLGTVSMPNFSFLKRALRDAVKHVSEQKPAIVHLTTNFFEHHKHSPVFGGGGGGGSNVDGCCSSSSSVYSTFTVISFSTKSVIAACSVPTIFFCSW